MPVSSADRPSPGDGPSRQIVADERLRLALESAKTVVWDWDVRSGDWVCFGDVATIFGMQADTVSGTLEGFLARVFPDDREKLTEVIERVRQHHVPLEAALRVVRDDGAVRWVESTGRFRCAPGGEAERMLGIAVDVTQRRQSEERFRQFFEALPQTCYLVTPTGHIADLNPAASRAWGYGKDELAGQPLATIIAPELHPKMWALVEQWKRTGVLRDEEMIVVTKSGERRTVLVSAGALRDADGALLHSASVQVDITERKQAEHELLRLNEAIARMDRLASMGEMAAALAHEVRQPLTALISNATAAAQFWLAGRPDRLRGRVRPRRGLPHRAAAVPPHGRPAGG